MDAEKSILHAHRLGPSKKWEVKQVNKHRFHITHYILLFTHRIIIHASMDSGAGGRGVSLQIRRASPAGLPLGVLGAYPEQSLPGF